MGLSELVGDMAAASVPELEKQPSLHGDSILPASVTSGTLLGVFWGSLEVLLQSYPHRAGVGPGGRHTWILPRSAPAGSVTQANQVTSLRDISSLQKWWPQGSAC